MERGLKWRILALYALVLALGAGFTWRIYQDSRDLYSATVPLVEEGLPVLGSLSALRASVVAQEPILYEYYATADSARFRLRWQANRQAIADHGAKVRRDFPQHPRLASIDAHDARIGQLASELDITLGTKPVDWDQARALLEEISRHALEINIHLDNLAEDVHTRVEHRAATARVSVAAINRSALFYGIGVFLLALTAGYFLNRHLAGTRERQRLAMFPERNTHPVFELGLQGEILYANPGARATLATLDSDAGPAALLPANIHSRLTELLDLGAETGHWAYGALGREFEAGVHYLTDFSRFHVYLTDVTAREEAKRHLAWLAHHDPLTNLPNRRRFLEDITTAVAEGGTGAVALLSIDRLRRIVDGVGHRVADQLLIAVSRRMTQSLEDTALLCPQACLYRFEGAVFGLLLPCLKTDEAPGNIALKIASAFEAPVHVNGQSFHLGVSIGASLFPADDGDAVNLISHADRALQQARGHGGYRAYDRELSIQARDRLELENHLRHALSRQEWFLVYQPQVEVASGRIIGAEALLRWRHPTRGLISPASFIPLAEETGLIVPIGAWVLQTACAQARRWIDDGFPPLTMAVNLSARQFESEQLAEEIAATLNATGLPPQTLELEVTESLAMEDVERSIRTLRALKALGIRISVDDFGTGYSSLAYLRRLPIDKLKVDQSFVRALENDPASAMLVRAIVELGHSLDLAIIAEGVENQAQLAFLKEIGCEEAQGYWFSRPLESTDFLKRLLPVNGSTGKLQQLGRNP
ncbi:MAG: bifunctional diguanylate cyclase/phosphodiesterase [Thiobacillus sp.]|nr:bifunctional diguanylate cyclase/phosphodiesterase [Thiobacillus sp.]